MVQKFRNSFNWLFQNRVIQHILFWSLSFLVLLNILRVSAEIKQIDIIYSAIFHVPILLIVYLNLQLLFPQFLEKRKYFLYSFFILVIIAFGAGFYILLFNEWIDYIFTGYYFIAYYSFWDISLFFLVYVFLTGLLHLARGWFRLQEMENEKTTAELKALKSQINPHFLFNSLNSIYSLSRKNSEKVPEKIVQLSDLLRHIIYDADSEYIPLLKEVEMIKNYIELQNLRTSDSEKIVINVLGDIKGKMIAPLIFLPFVENSFKHGLKSGVSNAFVKIELNVSEKDLVFKIENNKVESTKISDSKYKGIGIQNVKKRLELIYPDSYDLEIINQKTNFKVKLKLLLN